MRLLVSRIGALGDTLMVTPLFRALREHHPEAEIDFLGSAPGAALVAGDPALGRVFSLRQRNWPRWVSPEKIRLRRVLRRRSYRTVYLLESSPGFHALLDGVGEELRSYRTIPFDPSRHSILNNLAVAGLAGPGDSIPPTRLGVAAAAGERAARLLEPAPAPTVGIHCGYGPAHRKRDQATRLKGWPLERFARLVRELAGRGLGVVLTGSDADRRACERVRKQANTHVLNLAGRTDIAELAAVISRLSLLISVDSGPAHMAAAVGTPLLVLWGPAKWVEVAPVPGRAPVRLLRAPVPCAPCYDTPAMKSCRRNICMQRIGLGQTLHEALDLLDPRPGF